MLISVIIKQPDKLISCNNLQLVDITMMLVLVSDTLFLRFSVLKSRFKASILKIAKN